MKAQYIRAARKTLGLSVEGLASTLGVQSGRTVRRWESGSKDIPGPAAALLQVMLEFPHVRDMMLKNPPKLDLTK